MKTLCSAGMENVKLKWFGSDAYAKKEFSELSSCTTQDRNSPKWRESNFFK